ncbi:MAG: hypothetical protein WCW33_02135 [Candidatus Babeliales bacterium]
MVFIKILAQHNRIICTSALLCMLSGHADARKRSATWGDPVSPKTGNLVRVKITHRDLNFAKQQLINLYETPKIDDKIVAANELNRYFYHNKNKITYDEAALTEPAETRLLILFINVIKLIISKEITTINNDMFIPQAKSALDPDKVLSVSMLMQNVPYAEVLTKLEIVLQQNRKYKHINPTHESPSQVHKEIAQLKATMVQEEH